MGRVGWLPGNTASSVRFPGGASVGFPVGLSEGFPVGLSVDFLAPGREGDRLTAAAEEVSLAGRTGVYDVTVTNQRGERIAVFRGRSHRMKGRPTVPPAA